MAYGLDLSGAWHKLTHLKWYPAQTFWFPWKGIWQNFKGKLLLSESHWGHLMEESADSYGTGTRPTLEPWFWFFSTCPSISVSTDRWQLLEAIGHLGNLDSTLRNIAITRPEHHYLLFHWKPEPGWQQIVQPEMGFAGTQTCVQRLTHLLGKGRKLS